MDPTAHHHHTVSTLAQELANTQGQARRLQILAQALQCPTCRQIVTKLKQQLGQLAHRDPKVAPEYAHRYELFAQLLDLDPESCTRLVRDKEIFHHWGLAILLLEQARARLSIDPEVSLRSARLALEIVHRLDADYYGGQEIYEIEASARAQVFICYLELRDTDGIQESFQKAHNALLRTLPSRRAVVAMSYMEARMRMLECDDPSICGQLLQSLTCIIHAGLAISPLPTSWEVSKWSASWVRGAL